MAFYLARSLERLYPDLLPQLPAWLLRALTLANCLRHSEGEVASRLRGDLNQFSEACFGWGMGSGTLPSVCFWLPLHCDRLCSPPKRLPVSFSTLYTSARA